MRKLGLISTLWTGILFFPLTSFALGLGEIEASSFLNQPLKAEIEVFSARAGEIDDLLISLASRDAFEKAGLDRPAGLSKLRFKVEKSEDGTTAKILVSTKAPVVEPFLSFLIEADWAKGRLLREFTVLLDPLTFAQQAVKAIPQPAEVKQPEPVITQAEVTETVVEEVQPQAVEESLPAVSPPIAAPIATPVAASPADEPAPYVADNQYVEPVTSVEQVVVAKGDTLWAIATQFKDENHSMAQVMLAMQMMNPDAFSQDNINNLKVGAVLRVPDMDVMDRLTKQEAYAQVLEQNGLWDEYVARKSGATSSAVAGSSEAIESSQEEAVGNQLSLLTADDGDSDSASLQNDANSENAGQIRKQLALAEEELEAARLENDDLKSRIEMLEEQQSKYDELQKLVQIEDNSLAQLQQNTVEEDVVAIEVGTTVTGDMTDTAEEASDSMLEEEELVAEDKPSDVMINAADEMLAEDSELTDSSQPGDASTEEMTEEVTEEVMQEIQSTEAETVIQTTEETDELVDDELTSQPATTGPAPVIIAQPDSSDEGLLGMLPSMDKLLSDPIMLGGIGAILALLLGFVALKRKKKSDTDDEESITLDVPDGMLDDDETPIHVPSNTQISIDDAADTEIITSLSDTEVGMAETLVSEVDDEDEFSKTAIVSPGERPEVAEPAAEEQDDVLNEVDVYLAYGLYDNAETLLTESLQNSPDRADYRAKLLDTLFATKNKDAFVKEAEALKTLGGAANRFWDRIQIMGFELAPENELFSGAEGSSVSVEDLEYAKPDTADFDIGADEDVTDFSNTDFDLGEDSFDISATQVMDVPADDFSETEDLDSLDIDFPDLGEDSEASSAAEELDLPDDFSGDELGEDFNLADELVVESDLDSDDNEDDLSFDLPDELELPADDDDLIADIIDLDSTEEAPPSLDDLPPMDGDDLTSETLVMPSTDQGAELSLDEDLDLDMSHIDDAALQTGEFVPSETLALSTADSTEDDLNEFGSENATGEFDAFIAEATDEEAIADVDTSAGLDRTGTYAPGDFNEDELSELTDIDDIGSIEGLMLPDDVDEVSTKLDLAKAFIDMGDAEGARSSLEEVLLEGNDEQKAEATGLLDQIK